MTTKSIWDQPEVIDEYARMGDLQAAEAILFERYLGDARSVIDLGVGAGRTTPYLAAGRDYVGLDISAGMIAACRDRYPGIEFRVGDAADLSWRPDASADAVVFSFNGIDNLRPDQARHRCLQSVARVLRPGGLFIFSSHDPWGGWGRRRLGAAVRLARGSGYEWNSAHGGALVHYATPSHVRR